MLRTACELAEIIDVLWWPRLPLIALFLAKASGSALRLGLDHGARAPRHLTRPAVDAWGSSARVAGETITK